MTVSDERSMASLGEHGTYPSDNLVELVYHAQDPSLHQNLMRFLWAHDGSFLRNLEGGIH